MTKEESHKTQQSQEASNLAIISLVLGVVSLAGPGFLLGIPAIVTASIALKKKLGGRSLILTGLITGIISTVLSLLFCLSMLFFIVWGITHPQDSNGIQPYQDSPLQQVQSQFNGSST